jgi:glutamate-1-semialdehyde 2,1-aminomutase
MTGVEQRADGRPLARSSALFERARNVLAGGVSSDARRLAPLPLYVDHASGSRIWDADGTEYIDYVMGQGPAILGHCAPAVVEAVQTQLTRGHVYSAQHEQEVEVAELVCNLVPCAERVRFNTVGSEAVHGALRLARGVTGRNKILKFEGHYHGWLDPVLYSVHPPLDRAGSADAPLAVPGTKGQQEGGEDGLVICVWNDLEALERTMDRHRGEIAAVIMEPLLCNTGCIAPHPGYLEGARKLCTDHGALLIFDEVITGFRLAPGGAQEHYGVTPDLAVFGKAIAGGLPLACIAGRAEVMDAISRGEVGHAGTFNSNPLAIAAAAATLRELIKDNGAAYTRLAATGNRLMDGLRAAAHEAGVAMLVDGPGHIFQTYLTDRDEVADYRDFAATDLASVAQLHRGLLDHGVSIVGRGLWFLSTAHGDADVDATLAAVADVLATQ